MTTAPERGALERARTLAALRRWQEVVTATALALQSNPDSMEAWCLRSLACLRLHLSADALSAAQEAARCAPADAWPQRLIALAASEAGDLDRADAAARDAVALAPWSADSHIVSSQIDSNRQRHFSAVKAATEACRLAPASAHAHYQLGYAHLRAGEAAPAITAFERAIQLDPADADYHNGLGAAYARDGRSRDARAAYVRALELDPTSTLALDNLKQRAARDLMPVPRWIPMHPVILIPLMVGARLVGMRRWWTYRHLPRHVRREIRRGPRVWYHFVAGLGLAGAGVLLATTGGGLGAIIVGAIMAAIGSWWFISDVLAYRSFRRDLSSRPATAYRPKASILGSTWNRVVLPLVALLFLLQLLTHTGIFRPSTPSPGFTPEPTLPADSEPTLPPGFSFAPGVTFSPGPPATPLPGT